MSTTHTHPYYPLDVVLPGFQPQVLSMEYILTFFFSLTAVILIATYTWAGTRRYISVVEKLQMCWFLVSGLIHLFVEGAVVANSKFYQDTSGNILFEIWKEYSKADSRYATRDAFVIDMEAVTAWVWGPLCLVCVYAIAFRKSWRFAPIVIVSIGQLYGDVLYYMTCWHLGWHTHSRPEAIYFWFYFVIINAIWVIVPTMVVYGSFCKINAAVAAFEKKLKRT